MKLDETERPTPPVTKQHEHTVEASTYRLGIVATFTADLIKDPLELLLTEAGMRPTTEVAPYAQVFQELLSPDGALGRARYGTNVVLVRVQDWLGQNVRKVEPDRLEDARRNGDELAAALRGSAARTGVPHVLIFCPPAPHLERAPLDAIEASVVAALRDVVGVDVVSSQTVESTYPVATAHDPYMDELGHVPYSQEMFAALALVAARRIYLQRSVPYKVLALDCDNTLWRGVVGEDGVAGIEIDAGNRALQSLAVAQQHAGVLVCLCSKNNEADVWEVFARRTDMVLRSEHVLTSRIGWSNKSESLRALAAELNVGLDSFVFLDDNAQEIDEVRTATPEVLALPIPQDRSALERFVREVWVFDRRVATKEDQQRTELYRQGLERNKLARTTSSLDEFLASLELVIEIESAKDDHLPRVAQLIEKTNQFNTSTVRRSHAQLTGELQRGVKCLTVSVRDRFGDYGLVGVVVYESRSDELYVDAFMLSCRVLGKRVEHRVVEYLGHEAAAHGLEHVTFRYVTTAKSVPARTFLESIEAKQVETAEGFTSRVPTGVARTLSKQKGARPSDAPAPEPAAAHAPEKEGAASRARVLERVLTTLASPAQVMARLRGARTEQTAQPRSVGIAPRNATEATLLRIWEEAIGTGQIGVDAGFFDVGGTSLAAVVIVQRIRETLGVELPHTAIAQAGTIGKLAHVVAGVRPTDAWSPLVEIKAGSGRPVFFLHVISGEIVGYFALARRIRTDLPLYGFHAPGLARGTVPLTTVEEMASTYLAEVRKIQPVGPYRFAAHSFGAVVAFEMAHQLERVGEKTDLLLNMDMWFPMDSYKEKYLPRLVDGIDPSYVLGRLMFFFQVNGLVLDPRHLATVMMRPVDEQVEAALEIGVREKVLPEGFDAEQLRTFLRLYVAHTEALRAYVPSPYKGRMTLLRCDHPDDPPTVGWDHVCDDIEVIPIGGRHNNLLQKAASLDEIGAILTKLLAS